MNSPLGNRKVRLRGLGGPGRVRRSRHLRVRGHRNAAGRTVKGHRHRPALG